MMNVFGILFGFGLIALLDVPRLIKKKYWKELCVYGVLLMTGLGLSLLLAMGVEIPPVSTAITNLVKSVFKIK
jgi:hypothetical protein